MTGGLKGLKEGGLKGDILLNLDILKKNVKIGIVVQGGLCNLQRTKVIKASPTSKKPLAFAILVKGLKRRA